MRTSRLAEQLKAQDAANPPEPETNGQSHAVPEPPRGPSYEVHQPWWELLFVRGRIVPGGCPSCVARFAPSWLQRVIAIQSTRWFPRTGMFALWIAKLIPRVIEFMRVVTSGKVSEDVKAARDKLCDECDGKVFELDRKTADVRGGYCKDCGCPRSRFAELKSSKNWYVGHECPRHYHTGTYRGDDVRAEIARRQAEWAEAHRRIELPIVAGTGDSVNG